MIIPIVDESDKIIAHKERKEVKANEIYRVSALWVTNSKGEILLAQRAHRKSRDPGKWGPAVAGTVEKGETYEENIYKEAEEEIGVKGIPFEKGPKMRRVGEHNYFSQWFLVTLDWDLSKFKIAKDEVEEVRWFTKKEMLDILENDPSFFLLSAKQWIDLLCK